MITRIFFTSDIHGSEKCFRKFVNAGKYYKANVLILGGDITGKMVIPIVEHPEGTFTIHFLGKKHVIKSERRLLELEQIIRDSGSYPYRTTPDEAEELATNSKLREELFRRLMIESVEKWVKICEERLKGTGIKCFISPGNDDDFTIDSALESDYVVNPDGKIVAIDGCHEMISIGYSNLTPFKCPRDVSEETLKERIEKILSQVTDIKNCIFNLHCPPYNSGLDVAPKLDNTLKPVFKGGQMITEPVGSISIRKVIEKYQPLLGLHGHIHESRGIARIGRTISINPGSEYAEGVLRGAIINLNEKRVKGYMLTSG